MKCPTFFVKSGYPKKLLNSMKQRVSNFGRNLNYKSKANEGCQVGLGLIGLKHLMLGLMRSRGSVD